MSLGEFDLIERFFWRPEGQGPRRAVVGNGDDCAVIAPKPGMQLAVSTDTLVRELRSMPPIDGDIDLGVAGQAAIAIDISENLGNILPLYLTVVVGLSLLIMIVVFSVASFVALMSAMTSVGIAGRGSRSMANPPPPPASPIASAMKTETMVFVGTTTPSMLLMPLSVVG